MNARFTVATHIMGMVAWIERDFGRPATSRELAASTGTHEVYVRGLLSELGKAGLLTARRGRGGGVVLARKAGEITLAQVYLAVRDEDTPLLGAHPGATGPDCRAAPVIVDYLAAVHSEAEAVLMQSLSTHSVEQMSRHVVDTIRASAGKPLAKQDN